MDNDPRPQIALAISETAAVLGQELTAQAIKVMVADLAGYPLQSVLAALVRVRRECRRMALVDILERVQTDDGRPGPDEAWSIAIEAQDERATVVWTAEISRAFDAAQPLLDCGDKVGARMAFREAYQRFVDDARRNRTPVQWSPSLGWDHQQREVALAAAVQCGRLTAEQAPLLCAPKFGVDSLVGQIEQRLALPGPERDGDVGKAKLRDIKAMLLRAGR